MSCRACERARAFLPPRVAQRLRRLEAQRLERRETLRAKRETKPPIHATESRFRATKAPETETV